MCIIIIIIVIIIIIGLYYYCYNLTVTVSGEVYTWGDNDEGQLGDGTTNAIQKPRLVAALQGHQLISSWPSL